MNRRLVKRGIIGGICIAVILVVIYIVQTVRDVDLPAKADTMGMLAAVQLFPDGSQVVMIKPDGTLVQSNGYKVGIHDRDPVWRPDGNRLFFTSDREPGQINLYRWNPGSGKVERRTATQGSYTNLIYSTADPKGLGLVAMGGVIVQFDPVTGDTAPVLPPVVKDSSGGTENGRVSSIEGSLFSAYGTSFKSAVWFADDKFIVAIMKGDEGETLLLQDMTLLQGQLRPPVPIAAGDRIDMDISDKTGCVVFTLQGFKFPDPNHIPPENIKDGKVVTPFRHMVGLLDPKGLTQVNQEGTTLVQPQAIVETPNDQNAFGSPHFAPDGNSVVVSVGTYVGGEFEPKGLLGMPAAAGGGNTPAAIHKGPVTNLSFSGDGKQIAYSEVEPDGSQSIHVMNNDGSGDHQLLAGKGSFSMPRFSPQTKG